MGKNDTANLISNHEDDMGIAKRNKQVQKAIEKGKIEWLMWANVLGVLGSTCLVLGGILGLCAHFIEGIGRLPVFIVCLALGLVIVVLEWPRGARKSGRTMPRAYQEKITPFLAKLGIVWSNLLFRAIFYVLVAITGFLELATIIGGLVMMLSSFVYILAAFKKETWKPLIESSRRAKKGQIIAAPTSAPPRRPNAKQGIVKNDTFEARSTPKAQPRIIPSPAPSRPPPKPAARGGNAPKRAPPKPSMTMPAQTSAWEVVLDEATGKPYYYNSTTEETTWDEPEDYRLRKSSI
eukprot:m.258722 g.258722  ORF g.258722 m.258722 type:complete len:293 (-) comp36944_c0_seq1:242-1120(-)